MGVYVSFVADIVLTMTMMIMMMMMMMMTTMKTMTMMMNVPDAWLDSDGAKE